MTKKKRDLTKEEKKKEAARKRQHKLNSIKTEFEAGKIKSFEQVFAVMAESLFAKEMKMGYTTFQKKYNNPGNFTNNELTRFAELLNVDINIILQFVYSLMKVKTKLTVKV